MMKAVKAWARTWLSTRAQRAAQVARVEAQRVQYLGMIPEAPAGYEVPTVGRRLVEHARAHGWFALEMWTVEDGWPHYVVTVGRPAVDDEGRRAGLRWEYRRMWSSLFVPRGQELVLCGSGAAWTPEEPEVHQAPDLAQVMAVIEAYPVG
ncbi:hypothetical protein [Kitasatospora sp. NPDC127060]|uniref:hypothetical protein n=1 Tax=Kitasatospora sp. NPDC127060 TaxID=3347121 RepID=UPI003656326E